MTETVPSPSRARRALVTAQHSPVPGVLVLAPLGAVTGSQAPTLTLIVLGVALLAWFASQILQTLRTAVIASMAARDRRSDRRQLYRMRNPERRHATLRAERINAVTDHGEALARRP